MILSFTILYFCKNHNKLCCASCITKIKDEQNGQHTDCDVCIIKDIENEKKNKLKENIKCLENLSKSLEESINKLKNIFEKINKNKEDIKLKIQKIFTTIRNEINNREDELILEVDKTFNKYYFDENIIKDSEKLPNKIKESLEIGKIIENQWNNKNLNSLINDCLNIENNIKEINNINENVNKCNSNDINIKFIPEEKDINSFLEIIKQFGNINYFKYSFKKCPININEERKFIITGNKNNIFTKTGENNIWMGTICENELEKSIEEHIWKIKILKTSYYNIMIGVATIDFDMNSASYESNKNYGWYYYCCNGTLYSGPPHNYKRKDASLKSKKNEIKVIMNMKNRTLKFIIDNEDKGNIYTDIPLDKPISPSVLLGNTNDSVEITDI